MSKVILKTATTANDNKISQLTTGELAIVTNPTGPRVAFKDENDRVIYLTPVEDFEFAIWNSGEEPGSVNLNGFKFNKTGEDSIRLIGDFSYPSSAMASGGTLIPTNTLKLVKNSIPQTVTFTYSSNQSYATVDNTGKVTFTSHTNTSPRTATITAKCVYNGNEYPYPAVATQSAYPIYALSGSFSYSGNIAASGGTKTPTNTLGITKNGVAVSGVTITYSSNQSYATVDSTGKVTFTSHTNTSARTATITATVTDGTHTYTKTANVTQSAYVAPTETLTYYADIKTLSAGGSAGISDVTAPTSFTNGTFNYTVPAKGNTIILLCPSSKSLQSCIKQGEILDNITAELNSSVTNVTYNSKSYKMYQFRYAANIQGEKFEVKFN